MKVKYLFIILLKVLGLLMINQLLLSFFQLINAFSLFDFSIKMIDWRTVLIFGFMFIIQLLITWLLLFRTPAVARVLKLHGDIPEAELSSFTSMKPVILVAIWAVGIYLIVNELPNFMNYWFQYVSANPEESFISRPASTTLIYTSTRVICGFIILILSKRISGFIAVDNSKNA
jgi:hypothetical protein